MMFLWTLPVTNLCKCKKNTKEGFQGFSGQRPYFTSCCAFSTTLINKEKIHLVSSARSSHLSGSCLVGLLQLLHLWKPLPHTQNCHNDVRVYINLKSTYDEHICKDEMSPGVGYKRQEHCILYSALTPSNAKTQYHTHKYKIIESKSILEALKPTKNKKGKNILKGLQSYFFQGGLQGQPLLCPQFFFLHGCFLRKSGQWQPTTSHSLIQGLPMVWSLCTPF